MAIVNSIRQHLKNSIGKTVSGRYIVIESDDWGSIRMPSMEAYDRLKKNDVDLDNGDSARYNQNDTLASAEDFEALFDTLRRYRDSRGNHPVITAMSLVANPNFEKIESDHYSAYYFEPFTDTLKRYSRETALPLWQQGSRENVFVPEFHAREHLNVPVWLRMLQKGDSHTRYGFQEGCWGFRASTPYGISYQASFDPELPEDIKYHEEAIKSGLAQFETIHGRKASFFVPPNGPFNNTLERVASQDGIRFIGAAKIQLEPQGAGKTKRRYHWLGQRNKHGQIYLTRNAFFEPSATGKDWVASCLSDIHYAFKWKKPAVISSHRVNYIGSLNEKNRKHGLSELAQLLTAILKQWPDVEFITSSDLGNLLSVN